MTKEKKGKSCDGSQGIHLEQVSAPRVYSCYFAAMVHGDVCGEIGGGAF